MSTDNSVHVPVLAREILQQLALRSGDIVVDGTLGGGGHTRLLAREVLPSGRVIALDRDLAVIERARVLLSHEPVTAVHASFADLDQVLASLGIPRVAAVLVDLGLSSDQLADAQRGFSFQREGPLDMRMDTTHGPTAADLLASCSERELADLIFRYGEERHARRIARALVAARRQQPVRTTTELADIVRRCVPRGRRRHFDPATRTFQALRIAVNDELATLTRLLALLPDVLVDGGRCAIISFHSLEDRIVKQVFRDSPDFDMITRKPIRPTAEEMRQNRRARSARLRVAARAGRGGPGRAARESAS